MGFGKKDLDANTEFRHSAFLRAVSAVRPFEVKEGMEGEHTPETDLIRCHQGDLRIRFEERGLKANSPLCQKKRIQSPGTVGCNWVRWVEKVMGLGHKI